MPIVSIVGRKNAGKTTVLETLIGEFKRRGYRVAAVKHHAHDFEIDQPGKDSWRFAQAGSDVVVLATPRKLAFVKRLAQEPSLEEVAAQVGDGVDIILTEGYKMGPAPKIEVARRAMGRELLCREGELIALATDAHFPVAIPHFALDDTVGLADFIEGRFLNPSPAPPTSRP